MADLYLSIAPTMVLVFFIGLFCRTYGVNTSFLEQWMLKLWWFTIIGLTCVSLVDLMGHISQ